MPQQVSSPEELIFAAKTSDAKFSLLVEQSTDFILKAAGNACHRYIDIHSDEWSTALSAFHEAVMSYESSKGNFYLFAQLVIKRRLTDQIRRDYRARREMIVSPEVFSGDSEDETMVDQAVQAQVVQQMTVEPHNDIALEIEALGGVLKRYGFGFMDLTDSSPKAEKTKKACAAIVRVMLRQEDLLARLRSGKMLPIKILEKEYGLHRKILERHRKYIIAAVEILAGDYPCLAEYLKFISNE